MNKIRKRIALLISEVHEQYQERFIKGFLQTAFGEDCDVCIFAGYFKLPFSDAKCVGESNLYNMINYKKFDAVVVMPDMLRSKGLMLRIEKALETFEGNVLYVDHESKKFPFIRQDNYEPVYRLTEHLICEHGYRDIAFLNGNKEHPNSAERERAFRDCMAAHGLNVQDKWVFYSDYWYTGGERSAAKLLELEEGENLPRAIVCANDYMAVGAAEYLTRMGKKVPEDIAVVGFDSVLSGRMSPRPVTSIPLPSETFGAYAAECILNLMAGGEIRPFEEKEPMFIGSSCGCHCESVRLEMLLRKNWRGDSFMANPIQNSQLTENLVLQTSFQELMDSIQTYTFQIREFELFELCLNEAWRHTEENIGATTIKEGFSEEMVPILHCGPVGQGADRLDFTSTFPLTDMVRALNEPCGHPRAFFFTPFYFDDVTFGYAVISYGDQIKTIERNYIMWMQSLMIGMECFRRNELIRQSKEDFTVSTSNDPLTGMYNYDGFIKHAKPMISRGQQENMFVSLLALDIHDLGKINSEFGRKQGEQAIQDLSKVVLASVDEGALCCHLGNDEFIVAELSEVADHELITQVNKRINKALEERNSSPKTLYPITIHSGNTTGAVNNLSEMETLVNSAVSKKNGNKISEERLQNSATLSKEEEEKAMLVKKILDENLFQYHFQPIVDARTGKIYAYEALMRSATETFVSPLEILRFATYFNRLADVERATFSNVITFVAKHEPLFKDKKVFINSIPGCKIEEGEETDLLRKKIRKLSKYIVVELTEQTEIDDESLAELKKMYGSMGIQTAVDDYGTGYSNIVNLLRYQPDYVKIDRMLMTGIHENPQKQHFVKEIVLFAHENDFKVLAEGVETAEELEMVISLNVDLIQGYYTAKPKAEVIFAIMPEIEKQISAYAERYIQK